MREQLADEYLAALKDRDRLNEEIARLNAQKHSIDQHVVRLQNDLIAQDQLVHGRWARLQQAWREEER